MGGWKRKENKRDKIRRKEQGREKEGARSIVRERDKKGGKEREGKKERNILNQVIQWVYCNAKNDWT